MNTEGRLQRMSAPIIPRGDWSILCCGWFEIAIEISAQRRFVRAGRCEADGE
ncbi:hypothetical protein [Bradyrhizobium iriomotense]|uniref:hypothetical protein n=1 Tax=Bradyrhizobium iriomotense TaxID=441950 RepID=UPI0024E09922|nr:hypothetical protein [Bradyrhizobium iriomotense]